MSNYDYVTGAPAPVAGLAERADPKAARMRWMLELPDLSRDPRSPVHYLLQRTLEAPCLAGADRVAFPEVISVERNFDLLNAPQDHPSRRPSDTYYVDAGHVLRTQTTSMWCWYLTDERVRAKLEADGEIKAVSFGKVYRNDEIDRSHYPVFHQVDAVCLAARDRKTFDRDFLDGLLLEIARVTCGDEVVTQIRDDSFPFTVESRQVDVRWGDEWLEVVGAGLVHPQVLENLRLDPRAVGGWAFGFGLDRLAMHKMDIPDIRILWSSDERIKSQFESIDSCYVPVSKYPATERDISFIVGRGKAFNDFYEIVRECGDSEGEGIVERVEHLDTYENPAKFGRERSSHTFRITYRSFLRTLTNDEINGVQQRIRERVESELGAELR